MSPEGLSDVERRKLLGVQLLQKLGFVYLSAEEVAVERKGRFGEVLLEPILKTQIRRLNGLEHGGLRHEISDARIDEALGCLRLASLAGESSVVGTYSRLITGVVFEELIGEAKVQSRLRFIDWSRPLNNAFHVTRDFYVRAGAECLGDRADIVGFVNGIPVVVIEVLSCGYRSRLDLIGERFARRMAADSMPQLFGFAPILIGLFPDVGLVNTPGGPLTDWNPWEDPEGEPGLRTLHDLVNMPPESRAHHHLFSGCLASWKTEFERRVSLEQEALPQDGVLWSLCRPERLIEFLGSFVDWDAGLATMRLASCRQFFATRRLHRRLGRVSPPGRRNGGVFWFTQSGDDVGILWFLFRSLASDPRLFARPIVVVSPRVGRYAEGDEKHRLWGVGTKEAKTGGQLRRLLSLEDAHRIVVSVECFQGAVKPLKGRVAIEREMIILVDEIHRDIESRWMDRIAQMLPCASILFHLETPPTRKMKRLAKHLGRRINRAYPLVRALEEGAMVPLYYESRSVFHCEDPLLGVARDLSDHFARLWKGTGFGAVIFVEDEKIAKRLGKALDEVGIVQSELADNRQPRPRILDQGRGVRDPTGPNRPSDQVVDAPSSGGPDILIIVGERRLSCVASCDRVLYLIDPTEGRCLLGALSAISRRWIGKRFGLIVDYRNTPERTKKHRLFATERAPDFDRKDVRGFLRDIGSVLVKLPDLLAELSRLTGCDDVTVGPVSDIESLTQAGFRVRFYVVFSEYCRLLHLAHSSRRWLETTDDSDRCRYYQALRFFQRIRIQVQRRYSEERDYPESESLLRKLLHLSGAENVPLLMPGPLDILRPGPFEKGVNAMVTTRGRADLIANQTLAALDRWRDIDPFFCREYSDRIRSSMDDRRRGKTDDEEYYLRVSHYLKMVQRGQWHSERVRERKQTRVDALVEVVKETIGTKLRSPELETGWRLAEPETPYLVRREQPGRGPWVLELASQVEQLIQKHCTVGWQGDVDIQNRIKNDIDDYLLEFQDLNGLRLSLSEIDDFIERALSILGDDRV